MKAYELKKILENIPDDMEVTMAVADNVADGVGRDIDHVYSVATAAIVTQYDDTTMLLNTSANGLTIKGQLEKHNPLTLKCEKELYPTE